jgi:hypothetical protein
MRTRSGDDIETDASRHAALGTLGWRAYDRRLAHRGGSPVDSNDAPPDVSEDEFYERFPPSAEQGFGPDDGFNTWVRVNDESLFTEEALSDPAIRAFVDAPFSANFAQFKSSYREAEYFLHQPSKAMTGQVDGIEGNVGDFSEEPRVSTLVLNHERSLVWRITFALAVQDGSAAGQIIYKEE